MNDLLNFLEDEQDENVMNKTNTYISLKSICFPSESNTSDQQKVTTVTTNIIKISHMHTFLENVKANQKIQ